jgi:hypothetical protein
MTNADYLATLGPVAQGIAQQLINAGATLISTLRTPDAQAAAMATRICRPGGGVPWIINTYRATPAKDLVVAAVSALTQPYDFTAVETAILGAFATPGIDLREISWHMPDPNNLADAFDAEPTNDPALQALAKQLVAQNLDNGGNPLSEVLTMEGGQPALHVQVA